MVTFDMNISMSFGVTWCTFLKSRLNLKLAHNNVEQTGRKFGLWGCKQYVYDGYF